MNTESARQQMVLQQVRTWAVFDPDVLNVIAAVPRDQFVPPEFRHCAYADVEIPLAHGQCMLRPSIVGRILQALHIHPADEVLEIGTGTGYLTACIAQLAGKVTSIDIYADFVGTARSHLAVAGVENATLQCMDASVQLPPGHFDVIAVTGAVAEVDERFVAALKPGGRLFLVVGESPVMTATLIRRDADGKISAEDLFETDIPAFVTAPGKPAFSF